MVNLAPSMSSHSSPNSSKAAGLVTILVHVARINVPSVWQVFSRTKPPPCWHPSVISLHCSGVLAADGRGSVAMTPKAKPSIATDDISRFIVLRVPDSLFFIFSPLNSLGTYRFQRAGFNHSSIDRSRARPKQRVRGGDFHCFRASPCSRSDSSEEGLLHCVWVYVCMWWRRQPHLTAYSPFQHRYRLLTSITIS
jgi:hypothetical protein